MKKIIFIVLLLPIIAFGQKNITYLNLKNSAGQLIKGSSVAKRFERQIEASTFQSNSANNDTRISFTMPVGSASGELRASMNNKQTLPKGKVAVTAKGQEQLTIVYKINMENIRVESCDDIQSSNGEMVTQVVLRAVRIGWTYYTNDRRGSLTVSGKNGWDAEKSTAWTSF